MEYSHKCDTGRKYFIGTPRASSYIVVYFQIFSIYIFLHWQQRDSRQNYKKNEGMHIWHFYTLCANKIYYYCQLTINPFSSTYDFDRQKIDLCWFRQKITMTSKVDIVLRTKCCQQVESNLYVAALVLNVFYPN